MARLLLMPSVSANSTHASVQEWSKVEGETVAEGDLLAEIETDKAVIELTAEEDGIMGKTLAAAGATVEVGSPIAVLLGIGEGPEAGAALLPEAAALTTEEAAPTVTTDFPTPATTSNGAHNGSATSSDERVKLSPIARKLARDLGVDVGILNGSGPDGRIVRRDIESAAAAGKSDPPKPTPAPKPTQTAPIPAIASTAPAQGREANYTEIPHSGMRRTIARRLTESKTTVPHFYLTTECNVDALLALRRQINESGSRRISVNDFGVRAMAVALTEVPQANVTWTDTATRQYEHVDIAVAVSTSNGLITPIVRAAETKSLSTISGEISALAERARSGKLRPEEYEGGSFSVSNLGMFGVSEFGAIINPPHAGILAVGTAQPTPVVVDGALGIATVMKCTLSADHRSLDGELAARLLSAFTRLMENPLTILI